MSKEANLNDSEFHIEDANQQIPCPRCNGTGSELCEDCDGTGKVKCEDCDGHGKVDCPVCYCGKVTRTRLVNCGGCNGTGVVRYSYGNRSCDECDGRGQIEQRYKDLCPNCHGDYRLHKTCPSCDGKGALEGDECHGKGKDICQLCEGKGNVSITTVLEKSECKDSKIVISRYSNALDEFAKHADGEYLCALGQLYWRADHDDATAVKYWKMAADLGSAKGQELCGTCYCRGVVGCAVDKVAALKWYEKAAEQGNEIALTILPDLYAYGQGCEVDLEKAIGYYKNISNKTPEGEVYKGAALYAKKHADLLPKILNGDLEAMKELYKWLKNNHSVLKWWQRENANYWEKMIKKQGGEVATDSTRSKTEGKTGSASLRANGGKRRWKFVLVGIIFGLFGLQFAYARRWKFFFAHWAALIATLFFPLVFTVCLGLWFGSIFFMKRDGNGYRM